MTSLVRFKERLGEEVEEEPVRDARAVFEEVALDEIVSGLFDAGGPAPPRLTPGPYRQGWRPCFLALR